MKETSTKRKHYNLIGGVIVLLLIALAASWLIRRPDQETGVEDTVVVNDDAGVIPGDEPGEDPIPQQTNRLIVSNQKVGTSIVIDEVRLQDPGYVVIHADDNGKPGRVLARSALISAGTKQDLIIRLTTQDGITYHAMLHTDNGDSAFDVTKDTPIMSAQATPVMVSFKAVK